MPVLAGNFFGGFGESVYQIVPKMYQSQKEDDRRFLSCGRGLAHCMRTSVNPDSLPSLRGAKRRGFSKRCFNNPEYPGGPKDRLKLGRVAKTVVFSPNLALNQEL
jgi:hypothetical protein